LATGLPLPARCAFATDACNASAIPLERPSVQRETRCIH
jgi:hypothetical protein